VQEWSGILGDLGEDLSWKRTSVWVRWKANATEGKRDYKTIRLPNLAKQKKKRGNSVVKVIRREIRKQTES